MISGKVRGIIRGSMSTGKVRGIIRGVHEYTLNNLIDITIFFVVVTLNFTNEYYSVCTQVNDEPKMYMLDTPGM
jgi:hypothetical protein